MDEEDVFLDPVQQSQPSLRTILQTLESLYPHAKYDLHFSTPLELLVATQLAAQCTDERVNAVTISLFRTYCTLEDFASADLGEFEQSLRTLSLYRKKAKQIQAACQYLFSLGNGEVPRTLAEMVRIPGVGRKTANVVLGNAFGIVEGFIVDTHVGRLARRFGWTQHEDPIKVEQDLMHCIPQREWLSLAHRMIAHGRALCKARTPLCQQCPLVGVCPSAQVQLKSRSEQQFVLSIVERYDKGLPPLSDLSS